MVNPNRTHLVNIIRGLAVHQQLAPQTATVTTTLSAAQILGGILVVDQGSGATTTLTR